ncbi:MAG: hypothetical protein D6741_19185 [Planctomycetota bacterium]|nr:MAG: hypothetical protein D6741_19185 [Planctomycetota bacterium]
MRIRMSRRKIPIDSPKGITLLVVILVAVALWMRWPRYARWDPGNDLGFAVVERVVDGDTLLLTDGTRVRLIGIDTPETVAPGRPVEPFGPEATRFVKERLAASQMLVRLEYDGKRTDKFGRTLAHVWIADDDGNEQLLSELIVRAGLATVEDQYSFSETVKRRLREAEAEARAAKRGIWSLPDQSRANLPVPNMSRGVTLVALPSAFDEGHTVCKRKNAAWKAAFAGQNGPEVGALGSGHGLNAGAGGPSAG